MKMKKVNKKAITILSAKHVNRKMIEKMIKPKINNKIKEIDKLAKQVNNAFLKDANANLVHYFYEMGILTTQQFQKEIKELQKELKEELTNRHYSNEVKIKIVDNLFKKHIGEIK